MDAHSTLISPDGQYRQELRVILSESEISDLYQALRDLDDMDITLPNVLKDLRMELWYMLLEVREFNAYQAQGGEP